VVYVVALIIEAQAPNFAGQPDRVQALKAAGYSFTASWIAGLAQVLPGLYGLFALAGAIYSAYLLYLGLPGTMKVSSERAGAYTAVTVVVALLLAWVVSVIVRGITGISVSDG
jgi:hypothetical protein